VAAQGETLKGAARMRLARTPARGQVRLRTMSNLRWMAIAGQSAAVFRV
jgi:hypothetical protein